MTPDQYLATSRYLRRHSITSAGASVLMTLFAKEGKPLGEVAEAAQIKSASMTHVRDVLKRAGLVRQVTDKDDRRSIILRNTVKGDQLVANALRAGEEAAV